MVGGGRRRRRREGDSDAYRCWFQLLDGRCQVVVLSAAIAARVAALAAGVAQEGRVCNARQHVEGTRRGHCRRRRRLVIGRALVIAVQLLVAVDVAAMVSGTAAAGVPRLSRRAIVTIAAAVAVVLVVRNQRGSGIQGSATGRVVARHLGQAADLQELGCLQEIAQLLVANVHLAVVHEPVGEGKKKSKIPLIRVLLLGFVPLQLTSADSQCLRTARRAE